MQQRKPNLIYSVAFDPPGWRGGRTLLKMLGGSLLRTYWSGDILLFRNFEQPLFLVERAGLKEVQVDTMNWDRNTAKVDEKRLREALEFRFEVGPHIETKDYGN